MNILFVAAELAPHAKVGGLADVMAALPQALAKAGHGVSLVVPLHRGLRRSGEFRQTEREIEVPGVGEGRRARIWEGERGGVSLFALERDDYFDRAQLYGEGGVDYPDSLERFSFLARGAVELARYVEPTPEIIQVNDWHVGLVPAYVKALGLPIRTVCTVHNLGYQGEFPAEDFRRVGLPEGVFRPEGVEFYGKMNFLKGAIAIADAVTTVSPSYAREIQAEERGHGLHEVLREHGGKLNGILNGIDMVEWNPATDGALKKNFKVGSMAGRVECRAALEKEMGIEPANGRPIFGMVTRLTREKGVDLVWAGAEELARRGGRLVVLGAGDPALEEEGKRLAQLHPKRVAVRLGYDEGLARRIFAGADFFLMPSRSEPCGLTQMYAMRYGAIPVVGNVGGLRDTVEEWDGKTKKGTGFLFVPTAEGLTGGLDRALAIWDEPAMMKAARRNGMSKDWSWGAAVPSYEKVYRSLTS
ncbi:MAG: glycogen synthase GlgA [Verrucomicrobia bacterium]|nr:glycogen synthase GlgA [bacterium]NBY65963.1 glycogen synthase GlgA [Verrucomicrobiota bacterium]